MKYLNVLFCPDLIKIALLFVQCNSHSIRAFQVNHQVLNLSLQTVLGLFQRGTFGIGSFNCLLRTLEPCNQLLPEDR